MTIIVMRQIWQFGKHEREIIARWFYDLTMSFLSLENEYTV